jgi:hypothetical protein
MRALAGPAFLLVMIGGYGLHRALSKPDTPPREFTELEFAGPVYTKKGSCYSLSTIIIANAAWSSATRSWTPRADGLWELTVEELQQGYGGPRHVFQKLTFQKRDQLVHLAAVDASEGLSRELNATIDSLLEAPNERHSTPVDRCRIAADGYAFQPRR